MQGENMGEQVGEHGLDQAKDRLLDAVLPHVAFDGWSEVSFRAGIADSGIAPGLARALFPRGGVDLALAYHRRGDALMQAALAARDLSVLRYRERVTLAVRTRLEVISDAEAVRRGSALFALPQHAGDGAKAIWGTADSIWVALGDTSADINWYTKRATLSAVYAATVLYWLGDDSDDHAATWAFLDRRIEDVMAIEKVKARLRDNALWKAVSEGPLKALGKVRMPKVPEDLPGRGF
jgi:ubiquinone biosynthesis protein COQ9